MGPNKLIVSYPFDLKETLATGQALDYPNTKHLKIQFFRLTFTTLLCTWYIKYSAFNPRIHALYCTPESLYHSMKMGWWWLRSITKKFVYFVILCDIVFVKMIHQQWKEEKKS